MKFDAENFLKTIRGFNLKDLYVFEDQLIELQDSCQTMPQINLLQKKLELIRGVIQDSNKETV